MADTPTGETVTPGDSQTPVQTSAPATGNAVDPAEVERLRKAAEQATMRANQLENELAAKRQAEAEANAKKLEEDGQLKEALAAERAEKQRLLDERDAAERSALLNKETGDVLSKYSPAVVDIAKTAGLSLVDDSDEAKADLSKKLDDIAAKLGGQAKVESNNPPVSAPQTQSKEALIGAMSDPSLRPRDRDAAGLKYIGGLETIKAMKEAAGYVPPAQ